MADGLDRRAFLRALAATAAATTVRPLAGCAEGEGAPPFPEGAPEDARLAAFPQGVASGDPRPDGVLLWTRVEGPPGADVPVRWQVAADAAFRAVVASGEATARADADHTLRLRLTGLAPYTPYWYRFAAGGVPSDVGRTRTAPAPDADVPVRVAFASCQDYPGRWYHAWRTLLDEPDVDLVLFVGDYIYETVADARYQLPVPGREVAIPDGMPLDDTPGNLAALTLAGYRAIYRRIRSDPDLRAVHARYPFVLTWDDHEFANDAWQDHACDFDEARGDEKSPERRAAATRAWFEHLPVDVPYDPAAPFPDDIVTWRSLRYGRHVELFLCDTRYYRDDHVVPEGPPAPDVGKLVENSPLGARTMAVKAGFDAREAAARPTMLGAAQRAWLVDGLRASTATWRLWATPVMVAQLVLDGTGDETIPAPLRNAFYFKPDQWDGFRTERAEILEAVADVPNLVVLSGDLHGFYAALLRPDFDAPDTPATGVELHVSAISSASLREQLETLAASEPLLEALGVGAVVDRFDEIARASGPHLVHADSASWGVAVLEVDGDREARATFLVVPEVRTPTPPPVARVAFRVPGGEARIEALPG